MPHAWSYKTTLLNTLLKGKVKTCYHIKKRMMLENGEKMLRTKQVMYV